MVAYDSRTKLEALRDHFETFGKGANYLLIGNSAGFIGCLSALKEHAKDLPPEFHGAGLFVLIFGSGLLLGILFWFASMAIKISVTQDIIAQERSSKTWPGYLLGKFLQYLAHLGLWGSLAMFVLAVALIMSRFADALPPELLGWWRLRPH